MKSRLACWAWLLLAIVGCYQSSTEPTDLKSQIDPQLLVQRGQLVFVRDSVAGRQLAASQNSPCLLFFTARWCTYCHQMEETAFQEQSVAGLAKNFVCILVDADREPEVCRAFEIRGYPTLQFLAADGHQLHRLVGRQSASRLLAGMQSALDRVAWLDNSKAQRR